MRSAVVRKGDHEIETKGQAPEVYIAEQQANMARLRGEKELTLAANNINTEYKKRLVETKDLALRVEKQLFNVRLEKEQLAACRVQLLTVLAKVQSPLQLSIDWSNERSKGRPQTASGEGIERALVQSSHDLRGAIETLSSDLMQVDIAAAKLVRVESLLVDELKAKSATMILDRACMDGGGLSARTGQFAGVPHAPPPVHASPAAGFGPSRSPRSPRSPRVPSETPAVSESPRMPRALMSTHGMHTENEWRNQTNSNVSSAVVAVEESVKVRKQATNSAKGIEDSGKTSRPSCVVDALQTHIKYETQQLTALKYNVKMVNGEIATLDKHAATVHATLEKVHQQMDQALHRLGLQVVRPVSEANRTGVEEVLEIEVVNMKRTEQNLLKQLEELATKRARSVALRSKIEAEVAHRNGSLLLDQRCSALNLPALPQIAERQKKQANRAAVGIAMPAIAAGRSSESAAIKASPRFARH